MTIIITETPAGTDNAQTLATGEDLTIAPGVIVASDVGNAISGAFGLNVIQIFGAVIGDSNGLSLQNVNDQFADSSVYLAPGASISAGTNGIIARSDLYDVFIDGTVQANRGVLNDNGDFFNLSVGPTGSITSVSEAVTISSPNGSLVVHGRVVSLLDEAVLLAAPFGGVSSRVVNFGLVSGSGSIASSGDARDDVVNHGELQGNVFLNDGADAFSNFGVLNGDATLEDGADRMVNGGLVNGNVRMGAGEDVFDGRGGRVTGVIDGGEGDDVYILDRASDSARIVDADGLDRVEAEGFFRLGDGIENLAQLEGGDWKAVGNALANAITGNSGDNRLLGLAGDDTFDGGAGDDVFRGGAGRDLVDYSAAAERVVAFLLDGEATGEGIGDDRLRGVENLRGGAANDRLAGSNTANTLEGNDGTDRLDGEGGADVLIGGAGRDRLFGGRGADTLTGGAEADRFVMTAAGNGADVITDFEDGADRIDLRDLHVPRRQFADLFADALSQDGTDAVIDLARMGGEGSLRLQNVDAGSLDRGDFLV